MNLQENNIQYSNKKDEEKNINEDSSKKKNLNINPELGVHLCNELHCKELIFFDPMKREAICRKCADSGNRNSKDLILI